MGKVVLYATIIYDIKDISTLVHKNVNGKTPDQLIISNEKIANTEVESLSSKTIHNKRNFGFAKAANQAISWAIKNDFDYLCLFNQDVKLDPQEIENVLHYFNTFPDLAIISPFHLKNESEKEYYFNEILKKNKIEDPYKEIYFVPFVHAACWIMDLKRIKEVGGFNPIFFVYGEDFNYCHRLASHNFKIAIVPNCKIIHYKIDKEYDFFLKKKMKAHGTFLLAECLNPIHPKSVFIQLKFSLAKGSKNLLTLNFRQAVIHLYAFGYLLFKLPFIKPSRLKQQELKCFLDL